MSHTFAWFLLAYIVSATPFAAVFALFWLVTSSPLARRIFLAVWAMVFVVYSFFTIFWLPSFIFSWYEAGRWPASPLRRRQFAIPLDSGVVLSAQGREIRHASPGERDWWWDLAYEPAVGHATTVGSLWTRADSLPVQVERSDSLLVLLVPGEPIAFLRTSAGWFRSYTFSYPFLDNETYWRNLTWSMALDLASVERMHRDAEAPEKLADHVATILQCDLAARRFIVSFRSPVRTRVVTFSINPRDGQLALVGLVRSSP